jgi:serine protease
MIKNQNIKSFSLVVSFLVALIFLIAIRPGGSATPTEKLEEKPQDIREDWSTENDILQNIGKQRNEYVKGNIIVKFKLGTHSSQIDEINAKYGTRTIRVSPYAGFHVVAVPAGTTAKELVQKYQEESAVEYAELNGIRHACYVPNDAYYVYQWHLPSIFMPDAWDVSTFGDGAVVALLDSGVAYRTSGIYAQAPDLAGCSFAAGYDFVNDDSYPDDDLGHGTHMAGCIAQTTGNYIGAAGVAPSATIMPVKIMNPYGDSNITWETEGIDYAVNNGANIINLSLGGSETYQDEEDACDAARDANVVLFSCSGNTASSSVFYPGGYDSVVCVGAILYNNTRASYSNYGSGLSLCAPGGDLNLDQNGDGFGDGILQQTHDDQDFTSFYYYFMPGTSPACALASGVAALMVGLREYLKPGDPMTPATIEWLMESTATDLGSSGWDQYYGSGKINAYTALCWVETLD